MSRIDQIRELARLGTNHLAQLHSGDWDGSVSTWNAYCTAFDALRASATETALNLPERVALREVGEIHEKTERVISGLAVETRSMLDRLRESEQISGYAPVASNDRAPRFLDASA